MNWMDSLSVRAQNVLWNVLRLEPATDINHIDKSPITKAEVRKAILTGKLDPVYHGFSSSRGTRNYGKKTDAELRLVLGLPPRPKSSRYLSGSLCPNCKQALP